MSRRPSRCQMYCLVANVLLAVPRRLLGRYDRRGLLINGFAKQKVIQGDVLTARQRASMIDTISYIDIYLFVQRMFYGKCDLLLKRKSRSVTIHSSVQSSRQTMLGSSDLTSSSSLSYRLGRRRRRRHWFWRPVDLAHVRNIQREREMSVSADRSRRG